jgi:hypothetical protein
MTTSSDPLLTRVDIGRVRTRRTLSGVREHLAPRADSLLPAPRTLGARLMARAVVFGAASLIALRVVAGWVAPKLQPAAYTNPKWKVEVASTSEHETLALAYHRERGLHLYRIPASASADDRRVLPFDLSHGELYLVSLGWGQLDVRGRGPRGGKIESFTAVGRTVRVFSHAQDTGVRTGW